MVVTQAGKMMTNSLDRNILLKRVRKWGKERNWREWERWCVSRPGDQLENGSKEVTMGLEPRKSPSLKMHRDSPREPLSWGAELRRPEGWPSHAPKTIWNIILKMTHQASKMFYYKFKYLQMVRLLLY